MKQIEIVAQETSNGLIKIIGIKNCIGDMDYIKVIYPDYIKNKIFAWKYKNELRIATEGYGNWFQYSLEIGQHYSKSYFNECIRLLKIAGDNLHNAIHKPKPPFIVRI